MRQSLALVMFFASFSLLSQETNGNVEPLVQRDNFSDNTVMLSAKVSETVASNKAIVSVLVSATESSLSSAMKKNEDLRNELSESFVSAGIMINDIATSKFSTSPRLSIVSSNSKSFDIINRLSVKAENSEQLQAIAAIVEQHDSAIIVDTQFKHDGEDELHLQLKQSAMDRIMNEKAYYEQQLNVSLQAIRFSDSGLDVKKTSMIDDMSIMSFERTIGRLSGDSVHTVKHTHSDSTPFDAFEYAFSMNVVFNVEANN